MKKQDLMGQVFERLTVIGTAPNSKNGQARWLCKCICGKEKIAAAAMLKCKNIRSCGCLNLEMISARSKIIHRTHGATLGHRPTPEWMAWSSMRDRCRSPNNKSYHRYGGRGISVCSEWGTYEQFFADMGPRPSPNHSLDRIDNDGNYCKENCRWATPLEQCNNTRKVRRITFGGRTQSVSVWSRELGLARRMIVKLSEEGKDPTIRPVE